MYKLSLFILSATHFEGVRAYGNPTQKLYQTDWIYSLNRNLGIIQPNPVKHYYRFDDYYKDEDQTCDISEPYFEGADGMKINGCEKHSQCKGHRKCGAKY
jgi:hypothetical protein